MHDLARMIKAWLSGTYRVFPWMTLLVLVLVGIYAINPFDLIPDFIPFVGVIDDAAMLGFLVRSVMRDVRKFRAWEHAHTQRSESHHTEFTEIKDEPKSTTGQLEKKRRM